MCFPKENVRISKDATSDAQTSDVWQAGRRRSAVCAQLLRSEKVIIVQEAPMGPCQPGGKSNNATGGELHTDDPAPSPPVDRLCSAHWRSAERGGRGEAGVPQLVRRQLARRYFVRQVGHITESSPAQADAAAVHAADARGALALPPARGTAPHIVRGAHGELGLVRRPGPAAPPTLSRPGAASPRGRGSCLRDEFSGSERGARSAERGGRGAQRVRGHVRRAILRPRARRRVQ